MIKVSSGEPEPCTPKGKERVRSEPFAFADDLDLTLPRFALSPSLAATKLAGNDTIDSILEEYDDAATAKSLDTAVNKQDRPDKSASHDAQLQELRARLNAQLQDLYAATEDPILHGGQVEPALSTIFECTSPSDTTPRRHKSEVTPPSASVDRTGTFAVSSARPASYSPGTPTPMRRPFPILPSGPVPVGRVASPMPAALRAVQRTVLDGDLILEDTTCGSEGTSTGPTFQTPSTRILYPPGLSSTKHRSSLRAIDEASSEDVFKDSTATPQDVESQHTSHECRPLDSSPDHCHPQRASQCEHETSSPIVPGLALVKATQGPPPTNLSKTEMPTKPHHARRPPISGLEISRSFDFGEANIAPATRSRGLRSALQPKNSFTNASDGDYSSYQGGPCLGTAQPAAGRPSEDGSAWETVDLNVPDNTNSLAGSRNLSTSENVSNYGCNGYSDSPYFSGRAMWSSKDSHNTPALSPVPGSVDDPMRPMPLYGGYNKPPVGAMVVENVTSPTSGLERLISAGSFNTTESDSGSISRASYQSWTSSDERELYHKELKRTRRMSDYMPFMRNGSGSCRKAEVVEDGKLAYAANKQAAGRPGHMLLHPAHRTAKPSGLGITAGGYDVESLPTPPSAVVSPYRRFYSPTSSRRSSAQPFLTVPAAAPYQPSMEVVRFHANLGAKNVNTTGPHLSYQTTTSDTPTAIRPPTDTRRRFANMMGSLPEPQQATFHNAADEIEMQDMGGPSVSMRPKSKTANYLPDHAYDQRMLDKSKTWGNRTPDDFTTYYVVGDRIFHKKAEGTRQNYAMDRMPSIELPTNVRPSSAAEKKKGERIAMLACVVCCALGPMIVLYYFGMFNDILIRWSGNQWAVPNKACKKVARKGGVVWAVTMVGVLVYIAVFLARRAG